MSQTQLTTEGDWSTRVIELAKRGETGWVTIHGVHVHIDGSGRIDKGPDHMEGKTPAEVEGEGDKGGAKPAKPKRKPKDDHWQKSLDEASFKVEAIDSIRGGKVLEAKGEPHAGESNVERNKRLNAEAEKHEAERKASARAGNYDALAMNDEVRQLRKQFPDLEPVKVTLTDEEVAKYKDKHDFYSRQATTDHERNESIARAASVPPVIMQATDNGTGRYVLDGDHRLAVSASKGNREVLAYVIPHGKSIDSPETPAGVAQVTPAARAVHAATERMDSGDHSTANVDRAVAAIKDMPEADVVAGAKELGLTRVKDKASAIKAIRQHLTEQAEAASRVDLIGRFRGSRMYYLSAAIDALTPASVSGRPTHITHKVGTEDKQVPVAYFWKDAIAVGDYVHPTTKQKLSVDAPRIDGWVKNFHAMTRAGIEIPTPADHKAGALDNLGFVVDAKRNGDRLQLLHQVIGEDAAMVALRNRCSLCIDPDYTDERGHKWGDAFTHSAFTPKPVVTGMGEFTPFTASRDGEQQGTPIYYLSADDNERSPEMDGKQLREALGVAVDVPDDKLIEQVKTLREANNQLTTQVANLSRTAPSVDPVILADRNESKREKIELSMARGDMPKVVADKLLAALPADKPSTFMLSRHDGLDTTPIDFVLGLFKDAKIGVAVGTTTGIQKLGRDIPGGEQDADAKAVNDDADAQAKAYREARGIKD